VTAGATGTRGSRPGELHRRRVLLLAESAGLAAVLHHLLDPADRLARVGSLRELAETRALEGADVVVLDVPAEDRAGAVGQIRRRYLGPLVVLAAWGENVGGLRLDDAATLLARPFSADDLGAALARRGGPVPVTLWTTESAPPVVGLGSPTGGPGAGSGGPGTGPAPTTRAGQAAGWVRRLLTGVGVGGLTRRRIRVAGFSAFTLVAFAVAFALAAQGRCGPGCNALGIGFSPAPTSIAPTGSPAPTTTGPKRAPASTTAGAAAAGTGAFQSASGGRQATSTTAGRRVATTTSKPSSGGGGPGSTTPTTRPATTTPTTAPPTSQPVTTPPTTTPPPTTAGP
jgi:hypothetical protein